MLTIKQITDNTDAVVRGLEKKHFKNAQETIDQVLALNNKRKSTQAVLDANLAEVNATSKAIGQLMKEGKKDEAETAKARVAQLKETNKALQAEMDQAAKDLQQLLYTIPNVPYDEVPEGNGAEDNLVVKMGGMETPLPKDALPHWELAKKYDIIDFDLGVKITGAGFPVYKGKGARLQRALINFFLDEARASGYLEVMPPTVVNAASGYGTGQLPDKEGQMYHCEVDDLYLIPTAEVPVTNIYRDVILDEKDLPIKNCAYTECFRREAGSYGKDVRGLNRLHEFSKVELVRIDKPEHSRQSHQEMLDHVEGLLQKLELPYRILRPAAEARTALPHPAPLRRRHQLHRRHLLRLRGLQRGTEALARGQLRVQLRHLPGQPPALPLPHGGEENRTLPHAQRLGPGPAPHRGRPAGEQPDAPGHPHPQGTGALLRVRHD